MTDDKWQMTDPGASGGEPLYRSVARQQAAPLPHPQPRGHGVQFAAGAVLQHSRTPSLRVAESRTTKRTKRPVRALGSVICHFPFPAPLIRATSYQSILPSAKTCFGLGR
jgi:hypothetical protein